MWSLGVPNAAEVEETKYQEKGPKPKKGTRKEPRVPGRHLSPSDQKWNQTHKPKVAMTTQSLLCTPDRRLPVSLERGVDRNGEHEMVTCTFPGSKLGTGSPATTCLTESECRLDGHKVL